MPALSPTTTAWIYLLIAGVLEVAFAIGLKWSNGLQWSSNWNKLYPTLVTVVLMIGSLATLAQAVKVLPIGTVYAIWTGIGTVGAAILGIIIYKEPATAARIACIILIVAGVVGLKLLSAPATPTLPAVP